MSNFTLKVEETSNDKSHLTTYSYSDKEKAINEAYKLFKHIFYLLNPYGNDPDCVDNNGKRLMFIKRNNDGKYYLKTNMNGCVEINIYISLPTN